MRAQFSGHDVEVTFEPTGDAVVVVRDVVVGGQYEPSRTWLGFRINPLYPNSDVYPHYIGRVSRVDGQPLGEGVTDTVWNGLPALQLSRRSNHWNPRRDTAALKATKVLSWFSGR